MKWVRSTRPARRTRMLRLLSLALSACAALIAVDMAAAQPSAEAAPSAVSLTPITGAGSTWAQPAIHQWTVAVSQARIKVNYEGVGSTSGRQEFTQGVADFGASEIPYGVQDGVNHDLPPTTRNFAYIPDVAGGTVFMYNLVVNGRRVTNLRLSGSTVAGIFTNKITKWNDPAIARDNPAIRLPAIPIIPVVRSDGSGATADFTQWMLATERSYWTAYCGAVGRNPCTQTSAYPVQNGTHMIGQPGDPGVATYVSSNQADGAIGYVEYSWAISKNFPVAKVLNSAGYFTYPTPGHIAVSLLQDQLNTSNPNDANTYLTQNLANVYTNRDPRNYELSAYSYLIIPTDTRENFTPNKGFTLGQFGSYMLCLGQSQVDPLGYSALPINLVQRGFDQLRKIPGAVIPSEDLAAISKCHNPTFSTNGTNTLAAHDPFPPACDKVGSVQCSASTAGKGAVNGSTSNSTSSSGNNSSGSNNNSSGNNSTGNNATNNAAGKNQAGPNGTSASATTPGGSSAQTCDPNTGICTNGDASTTGNDPSGQAVGDTPMVPAASLGDGLQVTLMALAAGMLFVIGAAPPLIAQATRRSRQRRGTDEFYKDASSRRVKR